MEETDEVSKTKKGRYRSIDPAINAILDERTNQQTYVAKDPESYGNPGAFPWMKKS